MLIIYYYMNYIIIILILIIYYNILYIIIILIFIIIIYFQFISENKDNFLNINNQLNNNCQNIFNLELINLKKELVNKNKIIEQQKIEINNLKNQLFIK